MKPFDSAFCSHSNECICQMGRRSRRPAEMELCYRPKHRINCMEHSVVGGFTLGKLSPSERKTSDGRLTYAGAGTTLYALLKAHQPFYTCKNCLSFMTSPELETSTNFSGHLNFDKSRPRKAVKCPS